MIGHGMKYLRSNALGAMALFVALGGTSYAAAGGFSSGGTLRACANEEGVIRLLKQGKKCRKGQTAVAWNTTGPAGAKGATGATGAGGAQGASGPQGAPGVQGAAGDLNVTTENIDMTVPAGVEKAEVVNLDGQPVLAACEVEEIAPNAVALQAFSAPGLYWKRGGPVATDREGFQDSTTAIDIDVLLTPPSGRVGRVRLHATHENASCRVRGIVTIVN